MTHRHKFNLRARPTSSQKPTTIEEFDVDTTPEPDIEITRGQEEGFNGNLSQNWANEQAEDPSNRAKNNKGKKKKGQTSEKDAEKDFNNKETLEQKVDTILSYLQQYETRLRSIEKSVYKYATHSDNNVNQSQPVHITKSNIDNFNEDEQDRESDINNLIRDLEKRRRNLLDRGDDETELKLKVMKEDLEVISRSTRQPKEFDFQNQTAGIIIDAIKDPLAKVIEKRRLMFIRNWTIIWPHLQQITNRPAIPEKN